MHIFDRETIKEAKKLKDGEEFIFEYVAAGVGYQDVAIKIGDDIFYKMDGQESYCHFDKNDNMRVATKLSNGTIEVR